MIERNIHLNVNTIEILVEKRKMLTEKFWYL